MTKSSVHVPKCLPVFPTVNSAIANLLSSAEMEHVRHLDLFSNSYYQNNPKKRVLAAKRYALLETCKELTESKTYTIKEVFEVYKGFEIATIANYESFTRKLKEFRYKDAAPCTHGRIGKQYDYKVNPYTNALIIAHLSHPAQHSYNGIKKWVNLAINDFNDSHGTEFKTISKSTIAQYAIKYHNEISYYREGKKRFDTATRSYLPRISALNAGSLAQMDGSPIQVFCWNHPDKWKTDGKRQIRLNLFALRDAYSGKITGFDMSESEDRYNIIAAIKMMVNIQGHLPAELVHDNFSASKTDEFNAIKTQLEDRGVLVRAAKVGNAQDKGEVERFFGTYQSRFQRLIDGYLGEGIRSKRSNGRISEEFINKCTKENGLYGYDEMMKIIAELIAIYNNSPINENYGDKTPNQLYAESEKPYVKQVDTLDYVRMFWLNKEITVRKSMIINEVRKSKRFYEIWDNEQKLQLNGHQVRIYYDENEASEIHVYTLEGEFVCTCKQHVQIHEARVDQQEGEGERIMKHVAHRDALYSTVENKAIERVRKAEQFTGEAFDLVMPTTREKVKLNNAESQVLLNHFFDIKGINPKDIADREPVIPSTPYHNRELTEKTKKKGRKGIHTAAATYDPI
jgi:hypothetical protein